MNEMGIIVNTRAKRALYIMVLNEGSDLELGLTYCTEVAKKCYADNHDGISKDHVT
jgi:hypothetical protein